VFEVVTKDQKRWAIEDFLPLLLQPPSPGLSESDRLFRAVTDATGSESFEDDFSLLVVTFP
jgi:hypothetical protein